MSHPSNILKCRNSSSNYKFNQQLKPSGVTFSIKNHISNDKYCQRYLRDQFITQRRQNILNTRFNSRMNRLVQITKQNKKIHQRINAQKSFYSSISSNKSFDSKCSRKSKSSSRATKYKQSAFNSKKSSNIHSSFNTKVVSGRRSHITIESHNIRSINKNNLENFTSIFANNSKKYFKKLKPLQQNTNRQWKKQNGSKNTLFYQNNKNILSSMKKNDPLLFKITEQINKNNKLIKKKLLI